MSAEPHTHRTEDLLANMSWMRWLAHSLVGNSADADDLVQDAWIAASTWHSEDRPPPKRWLATIVRNLSIRRGRTRASRTHRERTVARDEHLSSTDDLAARMDMQRLLAEAVLRLPEPYRSTVILRHTEDLEPSEIARRQGVPPGTVRSRLKRALDMLREDLDKSSHGDRSTWMSALVTIASRRSPPTSPGAGKGAAITGGVLAMKKLLAVVLLLMFVSALWLYARHELTGSAALQASRESSALAADVVSTRAHEATPDGRDSATQDRVPILASTAVGATKPGSQSGWWLVGHVKGRDSQQAQVARLGVWESYASSSDPNMPVQEVSTAPVQGDVSGSGDIEIDLARLFADEDSLPVELTIALDAGECMPFGMRLPVSKEQRQDGYIAGHRVEFRIDVELEAADFFVVGTLSVPTHVDPGAVSVALVALDPGGGPQTRARDLTHCDANGHYRLRAPGYGQYFVVAFNQNDSTCANRIIARPAHRKIQVGPKSSPPPCDLELTLGETIEGRLAWNAAPAGIPWCVRATSVSKGKWCGFAALTWTGQSFEQDTCWSVADEHGRFTLTGLEQGSYDLTEDGPWCATRPGSRGTGRTGNSCENPRQRAHAPARGVELSVGCSLALWQVVSSGSPIPEVAVNTTSDHGGGGGISDEQGRFVCLLPEGATGYRSTFSKAGYVPRVLDIDSAALGTQRWTLVELERMPKTARIHVRFEGDALRTAENFWAKFHPKSGQWESAPVLNFMGYQHNYKRDAEGLTLDSLLPGKWEIELSPSVQVGPALDTWVMPARFEVLLAPGDEKFITIPLVQGGRVHIPAPASWGEPWSAAEKICFRMSDARGSLVEVAPLEEMYLARWNHPGEWGWASEKLEKYLETELFPSLTPGPYRLEVWKGEKGGAPDRTFEVAIEPGRTVELDVATDR